MSLKELYSEPVKEEWLDPYGHLNEGYYLVAFANAAWAFCDHFGVGAAYFKETGCGVYTLETHLRYLREVHAPAVLDMEALVFETDKKRCRYGMIMRVEGEECATFECVVLHFDSNAGRSSPLPEETFAAMQAAEVNELPDWAGRSISLK
jgi:acyl-CoA thioesterase FadM